MRIKVLRNLGRDFPAYKEGQEVDVNKETGEHLCSLGLATELHAVPPQPFKAVPPEPENSVEKATAELEEYAAKSKGKKKDA